jgi:hypothetical protein
MFSRRKMAARGKDVRLRQARTRLTWRRFAARVAKMPDDRLRSRLESARWLMERSKRETWRVEGELAEAEIERRLGKRE